MIYVFYSYDKENIKAKKHVTPREKQLLKKTRIQKTSIYITYNFKNNSLLCILKANIFLVWWC